MRGLRKGFVSWEMLRGMSWENFEGEGVLGKVDRDA